MQLINSLSKHWASMTDRQIKQKTSEKVIQLLKSILKTNPSWNKQKHFKNSSVKLSNISWLNRYHISRTRLNEKKKLFEIRIGKFTNYRTIVNYRENCLKKASLWKEAAWKSYCILKILEKKRKFSRQKPKKTTSPKKFHFFNTFVWKN